MHPIGRLQLKCIHHPDCNDGKKWLITGMGNIAGAESRELEYLLVEWLNLRRTIPRNER